MNVLHVTDVELPARHFNGYDLILDLAPRGIHGQQAVDKKLSDNPDVVASFADRGDVVRIGTSAAPSRAVTQG